MIWTALAKLDTQTLMQDYRQTLKDVFFDRRSRNGSYSLRAFARDIGMPASNLSQVLKGKKGIHLKTAREIAERLPLSNDEKLIFCKLVEISHAKSELTRNRAAEEIESLSAFTSNVSMDMMQILGGWHCFAILALLRISKNHSIPHLAKSFGFTEDETAHYLEKLESVELIEKVKSKYTVSNDFSWSPDGVPSEVIRKAHDKILDKAKDALHSQTVDERDFTSMMFDIDRADLPQAKKDLRKLTKSFYNKYSNKKTATDVYTLNLQFFNLTSKKETTSK